MTHGPIEVWRDCLKTDRRIYESMTKLEAGAILEEAAATDLSGTSVLNNQLSKRRIHEILVGAVQECADGKRLYWVVAKNIVCEFVLQRRI